MTDLSKWFKSEPNHSEDTVGDELPKEAALTVGDITVIDDVVSIVTNVWVDEEGTPHYDVYALTNPTPAFRHDVFTKPYEVPDVV